MCLLEVGRNKTTAMTKPTDFPSTLRQKLHTTIQSVEKHDINTMAKADETCPKCGAEEVRYTTLQLRSADEGSTVLYYCDCGHTYVKTPVSKMILRSPNWLTNSTLQMESRQLVCICAHGLEFISIQCEIPLILQSAPTYAAA